MTYRITFYCPDRHVEYDAGRTPDKKGVGGGVTARIRLAQALARIGHEVDMVCNCTEDEVHQGVHYRPLDQVKEIDTEILLLSTSGDALSLEPLLELKVSARLRILLIYGLPKPKGTEEIGLDYYYPPSNFIRQVMLSEWDQIPENRIFVTYFGVVKQNFEQSEQEANHSPRDPFRLAYVGHPSKGRDAAMGILNLLRKTDTRFHLHTFGDERLWGGKAKRIRFIPGVRDFGMINQKELAQKLLTCTYGMFLQARLEPYANTTLEALSAGVIPIASPVGGFPEQIVAGWNGYFIEGPHNDPATWEQTAKLILELSRDPAKQQALSRNARNSTYEWDVVAQSWEQHWDSILDPDSPQTSGRTQPCPNCGNLVTEFSDGFHCPRCGTFSRFVES
jgi:glycosyltransferase involved in cell wall biosynthesis/ribosomal protein S27AE